MQAKEGRWIYSEDSRGQDGYYCSKCKFFVPWYYEYYGLKGGDYIKKYKFCPRCGRKMIVPYYDDQKKSQ